MIQINGLNFGNAEYWCYDKHMKRFMELNEKTLAPYLERMYMNFELAKEELGRLDELTTITSNDGVVHCLDPLKRKNYNYKDTLDTIIVNDIGISRDFRDFKNDDSFFIYELTAELGGVMCSSLIDKYDQIHYWNPDWFTIDPHVVDLNFVLGE